jgi:two-component system, OmpR family, catabolic regulation response regulator CreB
MGEKILVIEDEPAIADNITYALSSEGFETAWCSTGGEGLAALGKGGFALAILDVMLPDMSGFDVCRELRKSSQLPVIFLTARSEEVDRVVGLELGGDDYVVKPFSPRELVARVKAVLRRSDRLKGSPAETPPPAGATTPFEVDEARHRMSYFSRALELSRYEFRILKILVARPGWVYSRTRLMEMAWEDPGTSMERTVDAHIKTLRAKLREIRPEFEAIITHRGVGYSIREDW